MTFEEEAEQLINKYKPDDEAKVVQALGGLTDCIDNPSIDASDDLMALLRKVTSPALPCDISDPEYLLYQQTETRGVIGFMPRCELFGITAQAKSGKSFLTNILASSLLGNRSFQFVTRDNMRMKVMLVDTEQSMNSTMKAVKRIHEMSGLSTECNDPFFIYANLSAYAPEIRLAAIAINIRKERPDVVVIDGIVDLLNDFNDIAESKELTRKCAKLARQYKCNIVGVIHENRTGENKGPRGHLGTEWTNKCADMLRVSKSKYGPDGEIFKVEHSINRNKCIDAFQFVLDDNAIPVHAGQAIMNVTNRDYDILNAMGDSAMTWSEIQSITGVSKGHMTEKLNKLEELGLITKCKCENGQDGWRKVQFGPKEDGFPF